MIFEVVVYESSDGCMRNRLGARASMVSREVQRARLRASGDFLAEEIDRVLCGEPSELVMGKNLADTRKLTCILKYIDFHDSFHFYV